MPNAHDRKEAAQHLIQMAAVGEAAMEYLHVQHIRETARTEYLEARDGFLRNVDPDRVYGMGYFLGEPNLQDTTGGLYIAYQKARRQEYNAHRRLETKWRQARAGDAA